MVHPITVKFRNGPSVVDPHLESSCLTYRHAMNSLGMLPLSSTSLRHSYFSLVSLAATLSKWLELSDWENSFDISGDSRHFFSITNKFQVNMSCCSVRIAAMCQCLLKKNIYLFRQVRYWNLYFGPPGCLQSRYGIHTFRVESIARGKATPVDELQVQGVSDPGLLRKVIWTILFISKSLWITLDLWQRSCIWSDTCWA